MKYVEIFKSLEGEFSSSTQRSRGFCGTTTVYLRLTGCNKTCAKFNNPNNLDPSSPNVLGFDPRKIHVVEEIPSINVGCDSIYAWHDSFSHLWKEASVDGVIDEFEKLLPHGKWVHPVTSMPVICSITGGEPLGFWQKEIIDLITHPRMSQCQHFLVETNASVRLKDEFVNAVNAWLSEDPKRMFTISNSPKLSASGEKWKTSIKPKCVTDQLRINNVNMYFKFVCGDSKADFEEVNTAMQEYWDAGVPKDVGVSIMPMACTTEQQQNIAKGVADLCMEYGFGFCLRLQNVLYGNGVGT